MAAIIPALEAGLPIASELIKLIVALVHHSKASPVAKGDIFGDVMAALQAAAAAGTIGKNLPPDQLIQVIIQAVEQSLIQSGVLSVPMGAPIASRSGQGITISVQFPSNFR